MKEAIDETSRVCKLATEAERKWDQAGRDLLGSRINKEEYLSAVKQYLEAVRDLESVLSRHVVAMIQEAEVEAP